VEINVLEVAHLYYIYKRDAIICKFNGYWPTTMSLYQYIHFDLDKEMFDLSLI